MAGYYSRMVAERSGRTGELTPVFGIQYFRLESLGPGGGYDVVITGHCLYETADPPRISVNGVPLTNLRFQADGRSIRGILPRSAPSIPISIDYGPAQAAFD